MNYFAQNLSYCRERFHVTQSQLALQLKKTQPTVRGWENKISEPNVEALLGISEFFGISIDHLIKTDLKKTKLITDQHVEEFKKAGKADRKVKGNDSPIYTRYNIEDAQSSLVKEPDPALEWAVIKLLHTMDEKLDKLLISGKQTQKK